jgi:hypothetical protein
LEQKKTLVSAEIRTLDRPARSPVSIPTTLSQLPLLLSKAPGTPLITTQALKFWLQTRALQCHLRNLIDQWTFLSKQQELKVSSFYEKLLPSHLLETVTVLTCTTAESQYTCQ